MRPRACILLLAALLLAPSALAGAPLPFRDCNHDGYQGLAPFGIPPGVNPYPAWLLLDTSECPVGSPWNDGTWVTEF